MQDFSQLKKDYGSEQADVIAGQVTGATAKTLSENFGKISQQKDSMSINATDTSITKSATPKSSDKLIPLITEFMQLD